MAVLDQMITDDFALFNGDCVEVMADMPDDSVHLSVYSPPFAGLYQYSSDPTDMSNSIDHDEFFAHYGFAIAELFRMTMPGRISVVHCMDIPLSNSGCDEIFDLPGRIIVEHKARGWDYAGRRVIWKEPLTVRNRTMMKSLHHKTLCADSTRTSISNADYLLTFRKRGDNAAPVTYDRGLIDYHGEDPMPAELRKFAGMEGDQKKNAWSQQIWRRYASSVWMDIRVDNVLPHRDGKDPEDEKHVHPLQLDVIARACELYSNPGETVLTPFMGVGSEVFGAVRCGRRGIGCELKPSYYRQACRNVPRALEQPVTSDESVRSLFDSLPETELSVGGA